MSTNTYHQVLKIAEGLSQHDQLRLVARLAAKLADQPANDKPQTKKHRRWEDIRGTAHTLYAVKMLRNG